MIRFYPHILHGGGRADYYLRSSFRFKLPKDRYYDYYGFRLILEIKV